MKDIQQLGIDDFTEGHVACHPPDDCLIERFEKRFGVTLPVSYLNLLRQSNGGAPSLSVFRMKSSSGEVGVSNLSYLFHLVEDEEDEYGVWNNTKFLRDVIQNSSLCETIQHQDVVAIGENGGGAIILLDLSQNKEEIKILYRQDGGSLLHIAATFEKFIDGLREIDSEE